MPTVISQTPRKEITGCEPPHYLWPIFYDFIPFGIKVGLSWGKGESFSKCTSQGSARDVHIYLLPLLHCIAGVREGSFLQSSASIPHREKGNLALPVYKTAKSVALRTHSCDKESGKIMTGNIKVSIRIRPPNPFFFFLIPQNFVRGLFPTIMLQETSFLTDLRKINLHPKHNFRTVSEDEALGPNQKRTF